MFQSVADAVEPLQPGSQAAVAAHFASSDWLQIPAAALAEEDHARQEVLETAAAATAAVVSEGGRGGPAAEKAAAAKADSSKPIARAASSEVGQQLATAADGTNAGLSHDSSAAEASRRDLSPKSSSSMDAQTPAPLPAVVRPSAPLEAAPRSAVRRLCDRAGLGRPKLLPVLHMLVAAAAAGTLTVVRSAYVGLGGHSDWVAFTGGLQPPVACTAAASRHLHSDATDRLSGAWLEGWPAPQATRLRCRLRCRHAVNSVFEKSSGRIRSRGTNRLLGTLWGVAWSLATIGLSSAAAGGSYANNAGK
jgi:hypothetical protein